MKYYKTPANTDNDERYCGACCYFKHELTDGYGWCDKLAEKSSDRCGVSYCSDPCRCGSFVSYEEKRHHMAMLRRCQRCLRDNVGTQQDLDVKAIGEAIDFIVDYAKMY
jgi:hypothetical protein